VRIEELELIAYGRYANRVLTFSPEQPIQLILGGNGAGKTTMLRSTSDLLFGFPERTPAAYRFAPNLLKLRGRLSYGAGDEIEVVRRKGRKNTLTTPDGEPLPDDALAEALAGLDQPVYETMFALTHERLRLGAQALLDANGELGQVLFGAALGTRSVRQLGDQLEREADERFRPLASKPALNAELKLLEEAKRQVRASALRAPARRAAEQELEQIRQQLQQTEDTLLATRSEHERSKRLEQVLPYVAQRDAKRALLAPIAEATVLPSEARERRLLALEARKVAETRRDGANEKADALRGELAALALAPELLERADEITELQSGRGKYASMGIDLPRVAAERDAAVRDARVALASVAPARTLDEAEQLRPTTGLRVRIAEAKEALTVASERERVARETAETLKRELSEAEASAGPAPATLPLEAAQAVLSDARKHGELEHTLQRTDAEAVERRREANDELAALPLWSGSIDEFTRLSIPAEETLARFAGEIDDCRDQLNSLATELERSEVLEREIRAQLADPESVALPSEDEIAVARAHRSHGWQLVRRVWLEAADPNIAAAFAAEQPLERAFEQSVAEADVLVDRSRQHAQAVALRNKLLSEQTLQADRRRELEAAHADAEAKLRRLEQTWQAAWPRVRTVLPPAEMRAWLRDRTRVLDLDRAANAIETEQTRLAGLLQRTRASAASALQSLTQGACIDEQTVAALLDALEIAITEARERQQVHVASEASLRDLRARTQSAKRAHVKARAGRASAQAIWAEAIAPTGVAATASPAEVDETLATFEQLFKRLDEANALTRRVEGMARERNQFEQSVADLVTTIAADLGPLTSEQAASTLAKRLAAAARETVRGGEFEQQLAEQEQVASVAHGSFREAETELKLLCELAAAPLEQLDQAEQRSALRLALEGEISVLEQTIAGVAVGQLDAVIAAAAATDPADLSAKVQALADEIGELDLRRTEQIREATRREAELNHAAGGSAAASAEETVQARLATADRLVEEYIEAKLAAVLLRQMIDAYRDSNEAPLLGRTKELFPRLTVGRFDGLGVAPGSGDDLVLVGKRGDEEVRVEDMSDGERDALYLSLRIASLEHHFASNDPVPVIVDDVLIGLDDDCVRAVLPALAELAACAQVILFTHHAHVVDLARQTLPSDILAVHDLSVAELPAAPVAQAA
jgi:uncharacterized protein YhaN